MAPLDLDKYEEIAKQCKYLPENDLKVRITAFAMAITEISPMSSMYRK